MKRRAGDDISPSPCRRKVSVFEDPGLCRSLEDVETGARDGFLTGRIRMKWEKSHKFHLSVPYKGGDHMISVSFSNACSLKLSDNGFCAALGDNVALDLRYCEVKGRDLPTSIHYDSNVILKLLTKTPRIINTETSTHHRFTLPSEDYSLTQQELYLDQEYSKTADILNLPIDDIPFIPPVQHELISPLSSTSPKKSDSSIPGLDDFEIVQSSNLPVADAKNPVTEAAPVSQLQLIAAKCQIPSGFKNLKLENAAENSIVNIIGVVNFVGEVKLTARNEYHQVIHLIDHWTCNETDASIYHPKEFKVNCFSLEKNWLPQPECGNIIILVNIRIKTWNGSLSGTGWHDAMQWGIYDEHSRGINYGACTRRSANIPLGKSGGGVVFSPFLWLNHPPPTDAIEYCQRLLRWREASGKARASDNDKENVIRIGGALDSHPLARRSRRLGRQHRLIREISPDCEPNGYFDCTVEILHVHANSANIYTVHVTDYTVNEQLHSQEGQVWVKPKLEYCVFPIEVWDSAAERAATMEPGTYYSFNNVRARTSKSGFLEGKLVEDKINLLDADDSSSLINLKALLQRKEEWEQSQSIEDVDYTLLKDFKPRKPANGLFEILHVDALNESSIYVTDWTRHEFLKDIIFPGRWAEDFKGFIVKIKLSDATPSVFRGMTPGTICSIDNLILKMRGGNQMFQGEIRGWQRQIRFHPSGIPRSDKGAAAYKDLEQRKKTLKMHSGFSKTAEGAKKYSSIKDILCDNIESISAYRLYARVVEYEPKEVVNFVTTRCKKCGNDLPLKYLSCVECNDVLYEFVEHTYKFFLNLEDENGDKLWVMMDSQTRWLKGKPAASDIMKNERDLEILRSALEEDLLNDLDDLGESPILLFYLSGWVNGGGKRCHSVVNFRKPA